MAKKKTTKKKVAKKTKRKSIAQKHAERVASGKETEFFEWLRTEVLAYCKDDSIPKQDQYKRRAKIAAHLDIAQSALKASYLYGQNKENIYKAAVFIGIINEKMLLNYIKSYPALNKDLSSLPQYEIDFYTNFRSLTPKEKELLSNFVENLIQLNKKYDKK
ncbi:MAG: hypothetical protein GY909_06835 [Oligoflexia bacterium]|nr:hypothetical protein [Oligoflexia bacterium]